MVKSHRHDSIAFGYVTINIWTSYDWIIQSLYSPSTEYSVFKNILKYEMCLFELIAPGNRFGQHEITM